MLLQLRQLWFVRFWKSPRAYHFLIVFISDLLVGAVTMLGDAIESSLDHMWYAGDVGCRIYRCFIVINMLASNNLLIGMSLDRYFAVAIPMKFVKAGKLFTVDISNICSDTCIK